MTVAGKKTSRMNRISKALRRDKYLFIMILPATILFVLFSYLPMFGIVMAFQNYNPGLGFLKSPWVGLQWFEFFVKGAYFGRLMRNTLLISVYSMLFGTPCTLVFTLLINEIQNTAFKRVVQTITYLPHFISTVIMVSMLKMIFSFPHGVVNAGLEAIGIPAQNFFQTPGMFRTLYVGSGIWQGLGWSTILYLAALTSISPELYEAAYMDGASRLQQMWHISLPGMMNTIVTMLILNMGSLFSVGYEKIYLMYNTLTYETADVISTYVYRTGLESMKYSYGAAIGLFNSVINFIVLVAANTISKRVSEVALW